MKFCVFLAFWVSACVARPDVSHLLQNEPSIGYLPSKDNTLLIDTRSKPIQENIVQESGIISTATAFPTTISNIGVGSEFASRSTISPVNIPVVSSTTLTENRFRPNPSISVISSGKTPTGSYLPTSGFITIGAESSGGDGSFLGLPGLISTQQQSDKSVYFYSAPEETAQSRLRINIIPSIQSKTRVIFIKAPTYAAPIPEVISAPSQTEDKTHIYVLSKKPDAAASISIPASTVVKPTKPEIFFIKYGTKDEAEQAVATAINGQSLGANLEDLLNSQTFIKTIEESTAVGSGHAGPAGESGPY